MSDLKNTKGKISRIVLGLLIAVSGTSAQARMGSGMGGVSHGGSIHQSAGGSMNSSMRMSSPRVEGRTSALAPGSRQSLAPQQVSPAMPSGSLRSHTDSSRTLTPATRGSSVQRNVSQPHSIARDVRTPARSDIAGRSHDNPVMSRNSFIAGHDDHRDFRHGDFDRDDHFRDFHHNDFDSFHGRHFHDGHFFHDDFFFRHHHNHSHADFIFVPSFFWPGYYYNGYYPGYCSSCDAYAGYTAPDYTYNYNYYYDNSGAADYSTQGSAYTTTQQSQADTLFNEGVTAFSNQDYASAVAKLQAAVRLEPADTVMPFAYAQALFASNQYEQASAVIATTLAQMTPYTPEVSFPGGMYSDHNVLVSQVDNLKRAVLMDPANANLQMLYGYELIGLGRLDDARTALNVAKTNEATAAPATALLSIIDQQQAK